MEIEYRKLQTCDKCGSENITDESFNEIHGHWYVCRDCDYKCWGGRVKNIEKNEKRPKCPTPIDLGIDWCQVCLLKRESLGYAETLETHHIDDDPANNERLNFLVVCTSCHSLINHERTYRYQHYMRRIDNESF